MSDDDEKEPRVERRYSEGDRSDTDNDRRGGDRVVRELKPRRKKGDRRKSASRLMLVAETRR